MCLHFAVRCKENSIYCHTYVRSIITVIYILYLPVDDDDDIEKLEFRIQVIPGPPFTRLRPVQKNRIKKSCKDRFVSKHKTCVKLVQTIQEAI